MEKEKNPGGNLSNSEIEKELSQQKNTDTGGRSYVGSQDTGDQKVRNEGMGSTGNSDASGNDDGGLGPRGTSSMG